jgi:hypothetical protein
LLIDSQLDHLDYVQKVMATLQVSQQRFVSRTNDLEYLFVYGKQMASQVEQTRETWSRDWFRRLWQCTCRRGEKEGRN